MPNETGFAPITRASEQQRVDRTRARIAARLTEVDGEIDRAHAETTRIERSYGESTKVNITEVDDRMETNAAVQQQKQLVARAVENEEILGRERKVLERLEPAPYFGRIDIDDGERETLYIGTGSLQDADGQFLVYDWRAPIASIYYNGVLGNVSYDAPAGKQTVDLVRKRQFRIEDGQIVHMFDVSETIGDEMLQSVLGDQSDEYMRSIVSTIQREQNTIIRDTSSQLLIVQGAAGSGKTSAILQRIAYLLYHSQHSLESEQLLLFSPNRLYATYISQVLPSLGEKNMLQSTLSEFLTKRFTGLQVQSLFDRYEDDHSNLPEATGHMRAYKESTAFMDQVKQYAKRQQQLHFIDIELDGRVFFSKETMAAIYAKQPAAATSADKFAAVRKTLMRRLNQRIKMEASADWVDEILAGLSEQQVRSYIGNTTFEESSDELTTVARAVVARKFAPVYTALYDDYFVDPYAEYRQFLDECQQNCATPAAWAEMARAFSADVEAHKLRLEDAAPIMMIRDMLTGGGQNHAVRAVFVDEMQDYSPAMLQYLHHAFPNATLTLLGDRAQDVFTSAYQDGDYVEAIKAAFPDMSSRLIELNRAYRSSQPITDFASSLLPDGGKIQAFARGGAKPQLLVCTPSKLQPTLIKTLTAQAAQHHSVAVITRTAKDAAGLYAQLSATAPQLHARLLSADDIELGSGLMILPVYLAKGLEFDAVTVYQANAANYGGQGAGDILYTAATRALHELTLIASPEAAPQLQAAAAQGLLDTHTSAQPKAEV
ncbi:RNA polymerase recycling motor HelD [Lacticaseibacillus songhuajiangensis]|uniref:RNA polymerase recycling motor HelD n=1 Tax=Lacticaseibacillus songhuajiangensis TaxID=1296539 RepID=UPI000F783FE5|nr:RNA polymerase recycling motor HelD [Lacticaseibacillus songhuajiangensis]